MPKILIALAAALLLYCAFAVPVQAAAQYDHPKIVINIPSRTLFFYSGTRLVKQYPVGIGRMDQQTPIGVFKILRKEINPTWVKPIVDQEAPLIIAPGPDNPLGYRWMEFQGVYGIHGTNQPESIGGYVSNGCVRMREADVEELYDMTPLLTPVLITYDRLAVQKQKDKSITLFIYPDEYQRAPLGTHDVQQKLAEYHADGWISKERLYQKLQESDGTAIDLGRPVAMSVLGKRLDSLGVMKDGVAYFPVIPIAVELKLEVRWDAVHALLTSAYGKVPGFVCNDILYVRAADVRALFRLYANWEPNAEQILLTVCNEPLSHLRSEREKRSYVREYAVMQ